MKIKRKKSVRARSIARRLNEALVRRSFFKTLLIDFLAAFLILCTWCLTVENTHGGSLFTVSGRAFVGQSDVLWNTKHFVNDIRQYWEHFIYDIEPDPEADITMPFEGIYYQFRLPARSGNENAVPQETTADRTQIITEEKNPVTEKSGGIFTETEPVIEGQILTSNSYADLETLPVTDEEPSYTANGEEVPGVGLDAGETTIEEEAFRSATSSISPVVHVFPELQADGSYIVYADASVVLSLVTGGLLLLILCQIIGALLRSLMGGGLIKQYLRPIDDIALMAEQLSSETYTVTEERVRREGGREPSASEQNEPILDVHDVETLTDALDEIEDSRARIEMHAPELSGLEESRRKQIRFVDDASHELRTPIAVIQGYAGMLDRWGKEDPKIRDEAIEAIKNEAEHIKTLLDQLLFLARGEMDRHVLELKPLAADGILMEVMEESMMLDGKHNYELILPPQAAEEKPGEKQSLTILADTAMIKQCVRILCDNAVRYTPEGGSITLRAGERITTEKNGKFHREICIEVADTGCGISAEELPRIFDRFYRGENARSDNTGGSGLGLSIARWIVEQHHGRIETVSSPGIGTKMTILLPAHEA